MRIAIVGSPGSGKTHLARTLASRLSLPLVHLDDLYWAPGWRAMAAEEWARTVAGLAARPAWIIDGNYVDTVAVRASAADLVILLDLPPWLCAWRVVRRALRWRLRRRDGRPARVGDGAATHELGRFLRFILRFRRDVTPRLHAALAGRPVLVLRSPRAVRRWLVIDEVSLALTAQRG
jgi:hypothetical protein